MAGILKDNRSLRYRDIISCRYFSTISVVLLSEANIPTANFLMDLPLSSSSAALFFTLKLVPIQVVPSLDKSKVSLGKISTQGPEKYLLYKGKFMIV